MTKHFPQKMGDIINIFIDKNKFHISICEWFQGLKLCWEWLLKWKNIPNLTQIVLNHKYDKFYWMKLAIIRLYSLTLLTKSCSWLLTLHDTIVQPCKFTVHVVLFPRSNWMTGEAIVSELSRPLKDLRKTFLVVSGN